METNEIFHMYMKKRRRNNILRRFIVEFNAYLEAFAA